MLHNIIYLPETGSTNLYLSELAVSELPEEGTAVWTDNQKAGRGQSGNTWESTPGMNLTFSMILYPEFLPIRHQFMLSKAVGLAMADFSGSMGVPEVTVKWPNDLYAGNKKMAGILIETALSRDIMKHAIIGIGLNVNQAKFSDNIPNPVSLINFTGKVIAPESLLPPILDFIIKRYEQLRDGHYDKINNDYQNNLYRYGISSRFRDKNGIFSGTIIEISNDGRLLIKKAEDGIVHKYWLKEVEFL